MARYVPVSTALMFPSTVLTHLKVRSRRRGSGAGDHDLMGTTGVGDTAGSPSVIRRRGS
jgi:hypothetical protein